VDVDTFTAAVAVWKSSFEQIWWDLCHDVLLGCCSYWTRWHARNWVAWQRRRHVFPSLSLSLSL